MEEQEQTYICKFCNKTIKKSEKANGWSITKYKDAKYRHQRRGWKELAVCLNCDKKLLNPL